MVPVIPTAFEKLKNLAKEVLKQKFPESNYSPKYDEEWIILIGNFLKDYQKLLKEGAEIAEYEARVDAAETELQCRLYKALDEDRDQLHWIRDDD